ncbi:MAG TPA: hypothetical protein VMG12_16465 [Polyangiaceae bacterium]|nr:hypothetical protein [Polyangiaceae bacterium]
MKICFWATSFQADNQALAVALCREPGVEVVVALDDPDRYRSEPVWDVLPFGGRLLDRRAASTLDAIEAFAPDCLIVDNHLPKRRLAPRLYVLWHGYGWRVDDLSTMKKELVKLIGPVDARNDRFRWNAFGPIDRSYRIEHSGFAPENVVAGGSPYSDLLIPGAPRRVQLDARSVQAHYRIDLQRPTLLLGMTWHHGGALGHWGDDQALHEALALHLERRGANLLIRMHDRHRYEAADVARMERLSERHPNVQLKFKSSSPDSLVDVLLSSAMISNYSSFLNAWYHTGKPSLHIDPVAHGSPNYRRDWRWGRLRVKKVADPLASWKLAPDDVGGLVARDFDQLLAGVDRALDEPSCCAAAAAAFNQRHVTAADGHTSARIARELRTWVSP